MAIVVLHGAFREPDNLFIDEAAEVRPPAIKRHAYK